MIIYELVQNDCKRWHSFPEQDVPFSMTPAALPVDGYSVDPYVGCTHGCKFCYASFVKRFTGHTEPRGKTPTSGQKIAKVQRKMHNHRFCDRRLLEQLKGSGTEIFTCTKSDMVVWDIDLLRELKKGTFPALSIRWMRASKAIWTMPSTSSDNWMLRSRSMRRAFALYILLSCLSGYHRF